MKTTDTITIDTPRGKIFGDLVLVPNAKGIILFAHGSGSGRFSPRNKFVSETLHQHNFSTLLLDLLTEAEERIDERTAEYRFDISLLASRLILATEWLFRNPKTKNLPLGYFGASTGAAAALIAAAKQPKIVKAIVSRGGRPDLAGEFLERVNAPTLLLVGGDDEEVIRLNEMAARKLVCEHDLIIIPGATHLFEEPGKLERVAMNAATWFRQHLLPQLRQK